MNLSVNPLTFSSYKLRTEKEQAYFLKNLSQVLNQISTTLSSLQNTVANLASVQSGLVVLTTPKIVDLGTVSGGAGQSVNCLGSLHVFIRMEASTTQTVTLTLSNLLQGASVLITINQTGTSTTTTLKVAATDTNGNTFTAVALTATTAYNLVTTGYPAGSGAGIQGDSALFGVAGFAGTSTTPRLELLAL